MLLRNVKIGTKIFFGFMAVVAVFVCVSIYQIISINRLDDLENESAKRAEDIAELHDIMHTIDQIASVASDAAINRNAQQSLSKYALLNKEVEGKLERVKAFAVSDEDNENAALYEDRFHKFQSVFENEIIPIIQKEISVDKTMRDSLTIMNIALRVEMVYPFMAGAVIDRELSGIQDEWPRLKETAETDMKIVTSLAATDAEKELTEKFNAIYTEYLNIFEKNMVPLLKNFNDMLIEVVRSLDERIDGKRKEALKVLDELNKSIENRTFEVISDEKLILEKEKEVSQLRDDALSALKSIGKSLEDESVNSEAVYDRICSQSFNLAIILTISGVFLAVMFTFILTRSIVTTIRKGVTFGEAIRKGNLTHRIEIKSNDEMGELTRSLNSAADGLEEKAFLARSIADGDLLAEITLSSDEDELGDALIKMKNSLSESIYGIHRAVLKISEGSAMIFGTTSDLSDGATRQAASLEEIAATLGHISQQTNHNAENASKANNLASKAKEAGEEGNRNMERMIEAMKKIDDSSHSIAKIINVIDEIAFQTNLLALNAAVEAARAGSHGKGFAVVAEEVRNLATRCARAANETSGLIEEALVNVGNGGNIADETARSFKNIKESSEKVSGIVSEIAKLSKEQAMSIEDVKNGLGQVSNVTQKNTATAEETASATATLDDQVKRLKQVLERFRFEETDAFGRRESMALSYDEDAYDGDDYEREAEDDYPAVEYRPILDKTGDLINVEDSRYQKY